LKTEEECMGVALGAGLYRAYVEGAIGKTFLRHLLLTRLQGPGIARKTCRLSARKAKVTLRSVSS
jgi:hypothetical protein